jgi:4-pyridoxate dehydrogenase
MHDSFDVVIVGAGSAGCVLANRLTRDANVRVLLLEAGGLDWNPLISVPLGARKMFQHGMYDWGDVSEPDPGLNARRMAIPHGKIIGGTSSINYMAHVRGHPADYDRWVQQGATGWSYEEVLPFFKECETWERGGDLWRGGLGELGAQEARTTDPLYPACFAMARSLGYDMTSDYNGEKPEGFGVIQYTVKKGRRSSSAEAFLRPVLNRTNLTVRTRATVTKLLFEGKRAVGVEYVANGKRLMARGAERTVLCLGAINTPHLLMLSGVGPADHLKSMGIAPLVDLPVGQNLEDHLSFFQHWTRKKPGPMHHSLRFDRIALSMVRAYLFSSGPAASLPGAVFAFIKSSPARLQPDLQLIIPMLAPDADVWFPGVKRPYVDGFIIRTQLLGQHSRGEILLRTTDPRVRPRVFYRSLSAPEDIEALRNGFRMTWRMGNAPELAGFRAGLVLPDRELQTDTEIDAFIRANAVQQYHPACTCRMGNDERAVLNPDLSVRGLEGLNVVDASAMPHLISGNPNVVIMMMAAKAAALWRSATDRTKIPIR